MRHSRTHRWILPGLLLGMMLSGGGALAQNLPSSIVTSTTAGQFSQQIDSYVAGQVAKLKTLGSEKSARDALLAPLLRGPTPSFLDIYATSINAALKPLAADKEMRVRLNGAIVNADVARKTNNLYQAEATLLFMKDKSPSVVVWGMKAAKFEIPAQLAAQAVLRKPNLVPEVVPAVKARGKGAELDDGPLAEEAYAALTLSPDGKEEFMKTAPPEMIHELLPELFSLLEYRISLYSAGVAPPSPLADNAAFFLVKTKVWRVEGASEKTRTMKDLTDLLTGISSVWGASAGDREELLTFTHQIGKSFQVLAGFTANQSLLNSAKALDKLSNDTAPEDLQKWAEDLKAAVNSAGSTAGSSSGGSSSSGSSSGGAGQAALGDSASTSTPLTTR